MLTREEAEDITLKCPGLGNKPRYAGGAMTTVESRVEELRQICLETYWIGGLRIEEDYKREEEKNMIEDTKGKSSRYPTATCNVMTYRMSGKAV